MSLSVCVCTLSVPHLKAISPSGLMCHIITVQTQEHVQSSNPTRNTDEQGTYASRQTEKHAKDTAVRHVATPQGDTCDQHKEVHDGWLNLAPASSYQIMVVVEP